LSWGWVVYLALAGLLAQASNYSSVAFHIPDGIAFLMMSPAYISLGLLLPVIVILSWRKGNREAGILLIPVLLWSAYSYVYVILQCIFRLVPAWSAGAAHVIKVIDITYWGPVTLHFNNITTMSDPLFADGRKGA
jgi:hypothetical protein